MKVKEALLMGRERLENIGIESAWLDSALLLMKSTGLKKHELTTKDTKVLKGSEYKTFIDSLKRRENHEPIQYIINECEFMSLPFYVDDRVLVPRPDTETLAEAALSFAKILNGQVRVLDMCAGSGALAVAMAYYMPNALVTAADIDSGALEVVSVNAEKNGVKDRVKLIQSDMFNDLPFDKYDIIMSNPPYIKTGDLKTLMPEVRDYEPDIALDGGADGLDFYRALAERGRDFLRPTGRMFLEAGAGQSHEIKGILEHFGYENVKISKDLAGIERVISACYNNS